MSEVLKAIKETEAAIANARAETRGRKKWAYIRETELREWASKTSKQGTDEELVRTFFADAIKHPQAVVEKGEDPAGRTYFAVWTQSSEPKYVWDADPDYDVLGKFGVTDPRAIVEVYDFGARRAYVVRTLDGLDMPPEF